jgi:CHAD domain-containing protein
VRQSVETEVKLTAGGGFVMPALGVPLPPRILVSTYHDTPDLRLAQHGITLRHRIAAGAGSWQLKIPHGASRLELEAVGAPAHPPVELSMLLVALTRGQELEPVARLRTLREVQRVDGAEVHDDAVCVLDGIRVRMRFHEIEIERSTGDDGALPRIERALRRAGATPAVSLAKVYRALDLPGPLGPFRVPPGASPRDALTIAMREQARRLVLHDPGTRLGTDPEDLHQVRVATRRLRAFLRAARPIVDETWAERLRAELAWLGSSLGPARDLDVMLERLTGEIAALDDDAWLAQPLLAHLEAERVAARETVVAALSSARYLELLDQLETVDTTPIPAGRKGATLAELAAAELRRARRAAARATHHPTDDELHALRIRVKRVRYALELAAHEVGTPGERAVDAAKALQDILGDHQDAVVAEARVRALAALHPQALLPAGRIVERQRIRRAHCRSVWRRAWRRFERRAGSVVG